MAKDRLTGAVRTFVHFGNGNALSFLPGEASKRPSERPRASAERQRPLGASVGPLSGFLSPSRESHRCPMPGVCGGAESVFDWQRARELGDNPLSLPWGLGSEGGFSATLIVCLSLSVRFHQMCTWRFWESFPTTGSRGSRIQMLSLALELTLLLSSSDGYDRVPRPFSRLSRFSADVRRC